MGVFGKGRREISCPPKLRNNHGEGSGKGLSNASTFRNNHPQGNSAKPAGSCVLNTQRNFTFLTRPCSRNHIETWDCFKKTATLCKTNKHCFRNKPIAFSLCSAKDTIICYQQQDPWQRKRCVKETFRIPNFQVWMNCLSVVPHTLTGCLAKPLFLCVWARLLVKEHMAETL